MTDISEHDALDARLAETKDILAEAAIRWRMGKTPPGAPSLCTAVEWYEAALAAKREALKPRLLTAEEARRVYIEHAGGDLASMQAALDTAHARAFEVIEAKAITVDLPDHKGRPSRSAVLIHDIRTALGVQP